MDENAFSLCANFLCTDRVWNLRSKDFDFTSIGVPQQSSNLFGKVGAVIHHRQQDTVNLELWINLPFHLTDRR